MRLFETINKSVYGCVKMWFNLNIGCLASFRINSKSKSTSRLKLGIQASSKKLKHLYLPVYYKPSFNFSFFQFFLKYTHMLKFILIIYTTKSNCDTTFNHIFHTNHFCFWKYANMKHFTKSRSTFVTAQPNTRNV